MAIPASGALTLSNIQTEFGGTNPIGLNEYYAGAGLVPAATSGTYGAVPSSGQITVQNFYGTTAYTPVYVEEVFSTYVYSGITGSNVTITNGIDLATKGGLIWTKGRNQANPNSWTDTARGVNFAIGSAANSEQYGSGISAFTSTGYVTNQHGQTNGGTNETYVSWTFRKQAKFFDVVTYTGNGADSRSIAHSLGSKPGCVIVKCTSNAGTAWQITNQNSSGVASVRVLNNKIGAVFSPVTDSNAYLNFGNSSTFNVTSNYDSYEPTAGAGTFSCNQSGRTYVAYLFAHEAGGFGSTGTDSIIYCGSFSSTGFVNLGWEPQWIIMKSTSNTSDYTGDWRVFDNTRGVTAGGDDAQLFANNSRAEDFSSFGTALTFNSTGFTVEGQGNYGSETVFIAIRRGPMKPPTSAASVFDVGLRSGSGSDAKTTSTVFTDLAITKNRSSGGEYWAWSARNVGKTSLQSNSIDAELQGALTSTAPWATMTGVITAASNGAVNSGNLVDFSFKRAPSFFDMVCYTGTGTSSATQTHNLGVVPELLILKCRSIAYIWYVFHKDATGSNCLILNSNSAFSGYGNPSRTATNFTVTSGTESNASGATYVAYLFATCAGVSKVGSYTGTGALQTVNCGFTGGARFVLIKRTDSTGNWWIYNSARGITSGNDPYLYPNSTAGEVGGTNYVDTDSTGFKVTAAAPSELNDNGGTYIFLAIA